MRTRCLIPLCGPLAAGVFFLGTLGTGASRADNPESDLAASDDAVESDDSQEPHETFRPPMHEEGERRWRARPRPDRRQPAAHEQHGPRDHDAHRHDDWDRHRHHRDRPSRTGPRGGARAFHLRAAVHHLNEAGLEHVADRLLQHARHARPGREEHRRPGHRDVDERLRAVMGHGHRVLREQAEQIGELREHFSSELEQLAARIESLEETLDDVARHAERDESRFDRIRQAEHEVEVEELRAPTSEFGMDDTIRRFNELLQGRAQVQEHAARIAQDRNELRRHAERLEGAMANLREVNKRQQRELEKARHQMEAVQRDVARLQERAAQQMERLQHNLAEHREKLNEEMTRRRALQQELAEARRAAQDAGDRSE